MPSARVIETDRLYGREMSVDDLDFIAEILGHPEVMRFYPKRYSRDEARGWIERQMQRYAVDGHGLWLIVDQETNRPVGQVGVLSQMVDDRREFEVGYMIHHPFWREGYAIEAALACRDYAFERLGAYRVISLIRPANTPSQGVARKLGMRPDRSTMFAGLEHIVYNVEREWRASPL